MGKKGQVQCLIPVTVCLGWRPAAASLHRKNLLPSVERKHKGSENNTAGTTEERSVPLVPQTHPTSGVGWFAESGKAKGALALPSCDQGSWRGGPRGSAEGGGSVEPPDSHFLWWPPRCLREAHGRHELWAAAEPLAARGFYSGRTGWFPVT